MKLSPFMKKVDRITGKEYPIHLLKIIGRFVGSDHSYKKNDTYLSYNKVSKHVQLGSTTFPFFTSCRSVIQVDEYKVESITPCTIDVLYKQTNFLIYYHRLYIVRLNLRYGKRRKFFPGRKHSFQHYLSDLMVTASKLNFETVRNFENYISFILPDEVYAEL